ncbi:MAG TPA: IS110 family transposase [Gammaproteobacteria bacterium]|nr:IS110 family transposase [Gammaproteobacteria bacterium]
MYHFFIGIDISKDSFVVAVHGTNKAVSFANNGKGFIKFYKENKHTLSKALVVLETTGGYEMELIHYLQAKKCAVHRANTRKIKSFIRSYGISGKTDSIDALALALYGYERHPKLELYVENPHKKLLKLIQRRNDLKLMLVQEKNRLQAPDQKEFRSSFQTIIKALEAEMAKVGKNIDQLCQEHCHFSELKEVLKTVKGIGDIIAVQLIGLLPELGKLDRKKISSLAGLAPHPNESGKKTGYRFTKGGRTDVKPVLFLAAMTAARSKSALGDFYAKLISAGKKKMVALTALMRKILVIANARVRDYYLALQPELQHG